MIVSPSQVKGTSWIDGTPPPPRMFPGVVHERTRRGSLRQGSSSEKDANAMNVNVMTAPRLLPGVQDDRCLQKVVAEELVSREPERKPRVQRVHECNTHRAGVEWVE